MIRNQCIFLSGLSRLRALHEQSGTLDEPMKGHWQLGTMSVPSTISCSKRLRVKRRMSYCMSSEGTGRSLRNTIWSSSNFFVFDLPLRLEIESTTKIFRLPLIICFRISDCH